MSKNVFIILICFLGLLFAWSCKNNSKRMESTTPEVQLEEKGDMITSDLEESVSGIEDSLAFEGRKQKEMTSASSIADNLFKNKTTARTKGFIIVDNAILYQEPDKRSAKVETLNKGEEILLIETMLAEDEGGALSSYPAWYQVESSGRKTGWVESPKVSFGH